MELISLLLYAADMVLLSSNEDGIAVMLKVMGKVSAGFGLPCQQDKNHGHSRRMLRAVKGLRSVTAWLKWLPSSST
jgi:hypothetical protein